MGPKLYQPNYHVLGEQGDEGEEPCVAWEAGVTPGFEEDGPTYEGDGARPRRELSWPELPERRKIADDQVQLREREGVKLQKWFVVNIGRSINILPSLPTLAGGLLKQYGRHMYRERDTITATGIHL